MNGEVWNRWYKNNEDAEVDLGNRLNGAKGYNSVKRHIRGTAGGRGKRRGLKDPRNAARLPY